MIPARRVLSNLAAAALILGCAPTTNLLNPGSPRFSAEYATQIADTTSPPQLRIVTFNIKLARRIDRAIEVLRSDSLRDADIIALEEMDDAGVDRIARALRLNYVYYPGSIPTRPITSTSARRSSPAGRSSRAGSCCCRTRAGSGTSGGPLPAPSSGWVIDGSECMLCIWRRPSGSPRRHERTRSAPCCPMPPISPARS